MQNIILSLEEHKHKDHSHIKLSVKDLNPEKSKLNDTDEGCPCCAVGIDLDEVATAISEIGKESSSNSGTSDGTNDDNSVIGVADFSDASHWAIFLGITGPLSLIGLTAAYRNIKGTINTKQKLNQVIKGLEEDIKKYRAEGNISVTQRLEAFKKSLEHSRFDTNFNLVVPGIINGTSSAITLSSAILNTPLALPAISLYSACQTGKNLYELIRTWNSILPEHLTIRQLEIAGIKKVNQITKSKRNFYTANAAGFLIFTIGGIVLFLSIISAIPGASALIAGIVLLVIGSISTGIMNNIWTNKFKPRNGKLGIKREKLDTLITLEEIGKRRQIKKSLKIYRNKHIPYSVSENIKRFLYKFVTSFPFCAKYGASLLHKLNTAKCKQRNNKHYNTLTKERLNLLQSIMQVSVPYFCFNKDDLNHIKVFRALKELNLEGQVLEAFVNKHIFNTHKEHNTTIKNLSEYKQKLLQSGFFKEAKDTKHHHDQKHNHDSHTNDHLSSDNCSDEHCKHKPSHDHKHKHNHHHNIAMIEFDLDSLKQNSDALKQFMDLLENYLLFEYLEKLRYEQYGLNDYFWELNKCELQQKNIKNTEPVINIKNLPSEKKDSNLCKHQNKKDKCNTCHTHKHLSDNNKPHHNHNADRQYA